MNVVHENRSPAENSLRTDSVIMKPRCVSSSSSGSLESIAQMRVRDIAVLTTRCNTRTSTTWQVVGASCRSKFYAKISYRSIRRNEGNVLFNDALNTFYLRLYGIGHMVKDHSDSERGNPLPPHGLLFPISSKSSFICIIPQTG